ARAGRRAAVLLQSPGIGCRPAGRQARAPDRMNIKYRQLKGFVFAAELGSFKAAANALSITQPSFSMLMKELEDTLGLALFERTARKCELTQAGHMFLRDIPDVLAQLEQSYRRMTDMAQGHGGSLSIATLGSLSV